MLSAPTHAPEPRARQTDEEMAWDTLALSAPDTEEPVMMLLETIDADEGIEVEDRIRVELLPTDADADKGIELIDGAEV